MITSIVDGLRRSATANGRGVAVEADGATMSYEDLWEESSRLAGHLRGIGIELGDRVVIAIGNSIAYVVAYFATLLAGGVAVPINIGAKRRDFDVWLRHSEPKLVIARDPQPELAACAAEFSLRVMQIDERGRAAGPVAVDGVFRPVEFIAASQQPALILYTSGTTGRPKGVLLSHGNLASNAESIAAYLKLGQDDAAVVVLPFYYSYGSSILHSHIVAGGRLVLANNFVYPHAVMETLSKTRATGFGGVPSTFALLLSRVQLANYELSHLRYVTQAGGPMSPKLAHALQSALPGVEVIAMYGQTEATARLTYLPAADLESRRGSVGMPIPGVELQVRLESGKVAAANEIGEVWARGPNVMLGYWRDERATRDVLCDGWLRTGDIGYLDADGYLFLQGRRSDIIKVGAHRVHPAEIEEVICEVPGVIEAAVVGVEDDILGQAIHAYVVTEVGSDLQAAAIQAHCRDRLPLFKIPKHLEFRRELPKTASGKLQRAKIQQQ